MPRIPATREGALARLLSNGGRARVWEALLQAGDTGIERADLIARTGLRATNDALAGLAQLELAERCSTSRPAQWRRTPLAQFIAAHDRPMPS